MSKYETVLDYIDELGDDEIDDLASALKKLDPTSLTDRELTVVSGVIDVYNEC